MSGPERKRVESLGRLENGLRQGGDWYQWGPYVSERQWGTVREDYSEGGDAWNYFTHDQARSRAYRWGEDGLGGICDDHQVLCFALALWNGKDPILKERLFGLTNSEGNHGEDVKEYYFYLDNTPTHSYMAEVYWDLEWTMLQQGFDYAYDKRLYDRLREGHARAVREHLLAGLDFQNRLARFLENHDEPRAAATFAPGMSAGTETSRISRVSEVAVSLWRRPPGI